MTNWNYATVWETVTDLQPEAIAITQGSHDLIWAEFDKGADALAKHLLDLGLKRQDKVALYLYNCPEYLQGMFGAMKAALVPVNTNYRYEAEELAFLWTNADAAAVVFHGSFSDRVEQVRERVPGVRSWLWVDDRSGPCPSWATPYGTLMPATGRVFPEWGRSGDDIYMMYTGGTTGLPKGVMWRQDDLFAKLIDGGTRHYDVEGGLEGVRKSFQLQPNRSTLLPACPLMHATGSVTSNTSLTEGNRVCLLESRHFDPVELLDTIERERVNGLVLVGDPFSIPLLTELDERPERWDLSSLKIVISSGAMWSEPVKQRLLKHHPKVLLVDAFSSSEALGMGVSVSGGGSKAAKTGSFKLGPNVQVVSESGAPVRPGSNEVGLLALSGRGPIGYYKDQEKTDRTFKDVRGTRMAVPGDYATVDVDGRIHLLGRGSGCINSGGEKIFPEEVEEALKSHEEIRDAVVFGVPDQRFGERVVAVVEAFDHQRPPEELDLIEHARSGLARYKVPREIRYAQTIGRAPNGKVDYKFHRDRWLESRDEQSH